MLMAYTTAEKVRTKILGVEASDAPDDVLNPLIEDATKIVIRRVSVRVLNEQPTQGSNSKEYYLAHEFIADVNGDKQVDKNDVKVYAWDIFGDESTKTEVEVEHLNPLTGRIVLKDDPQGKTITVDYSYYLNQIDWDLMDLATAYYAAKMWIERELMLVPPTFRVGRVSTKHYEYWNTCNSEFERIMHLLVVCPMDKVSYKKIISTPRGKALEEELDD